MCSIDDSQNSKLLFKMAFSKLFNFLVIIFLLFGAYVFINVNTNNCLLKHRLYRYCNIDNFPEGNEATLTDLNDNQETTIPFLNQSSLRLVYMLVRHGDRNFLSRDFLKPSVPYTNLSCLKNTFIYSDKVSEAYHRSLDYIRNSEKLAASFDEAGRKYLTDLKFNADCQTSQLTVRGLVQMYLLGEFFAEKYQKVVKAGQKIDLNVQTTNFERTVQSAISFLAGFLSHKTDKLSSEIETFKVNTSPSPFLLNTRDGQAVDCKNLEQSFKKAKNQTFNESLTHSFSTLKPTLEKFIDADSITITTISKITDILYVNYCHLNPESKSKSLNQLITDSEQLGLVLLSDQLLKQKYSHLNPKLLMLPIITRFIESVEKINDDQLKANFDFAHDTTVLNLLLLLGLEDKELVWPELAARVVFEIWQDNKTGQKNIRILHNGRDITCQSKLCTDSCSNTTPPVTVYERFISLSPNSQTQPVCSWDSFKSNLLANKSLDELWSQFNNNYC